MRCERCDTIGHTINNVATQSSNIILLLGRIKSLRSEKRTAIVVQTLETVIRQLKQAIIDREASSQILKMPPIIIHEMLVTEAREFLTSYTIIKKICDGFFI